VALNQIARGVTCLRTGISNVYFVGKTGKRWFLLDTGIRDSARKIRAAAETIYGLDAPPTAILLTHGHADHAGSAAELAGYWNVPIYAHPLEMPYLTGRSQYPPPDPTVGGYLAMITRFIVLKPCNLGDRVRALPPSLDEIGMDGWQWHHTPGHSPGHVAFFRPSDGTLLAGDALTTVNLDSFFATIMTHRHIWRPPTPSTPDWIEARESVRLLAELQPITIGSGHGLPVSGDKAVLELAELATHFPIPETGRYVKEPARMDDRGVISLPPRPPDALPGIALVVGVAAAAGTLFALAARRRNARAAELGTGA
jgi:glyoxylase-like metal-dependent hydrolase (beta-lactamase superfamily II)